MEKVQTYRKLMLNKRTISMLHSSSFIRNLKMYDTKDTTTWTVKCTLPECGSVDAGCRTNNLQSCAPCVPPTKGPTVDTAKCFMGN